MKTFEIEVKKTITAQDIDNLLSAAFEGGINYWADEARIANNKDGEFKGWASEALTNGYAVNIHDAEDDKWRQLTLKRLLKALGKLDIDFDNYDATDADNVVQTALFGEVIYG